MIKSFMNKNTLQFEVGKKKNIKKILVKINYILENNNAL